MTVERRASSRARARRRRTSTAWSSASARSAWSPALTLDVEPAYEVRQRVFEGLAWDALFEHFDEITGGRLQRQRVHPLGRRRSTRCGSRAASTDAPEDVRGRPLRRAPGDRRPAPDPRHRPGQLHAPARPARPVVGPPAALPHGLHPEHRRGAAVRVPRAARSTPSAAIEAVRALGRPHPPGPPGLRDPHGRRRPAVDEPAVRPGHASRIHFTWAREPDAVARGARRRRGRARAVRRAPALGQALPRRRGGDRAALRAPARLRAPRRDARPARRVPQRAGSKPGYWVSDDGHDLRHHRQRLALASSSSASRARRPTASAPPASSRRSAERGAEMTARWGVPAFGSVAELLRRGGARLRHRLASPGRRRRTPRASSSALGARVLAETPPAPDLPGLRALWADVGGSGLVQVAEQYLLMPGARGAAGGGARGRDRRADLGAGLLDAPLPRGLDDPRAARRRLRAGGRVARGRSPRRWPTRSARRLDAATPRRRTPRRRSPRSTSAGGMGLYDFTDNQWWNPLRARRIVIRGSHGEIVDDRVVRLADPTTPVESPARAPPDRHRPQPRGRRPRPHQLRRARRLPQPVLGHAALRGRHRRRRAAGADRRLGARRGAGALPAGRGPAGPPDQPRDRGVASRPAAT